MSRRKRPVSTDILATRIPTERTSRTRPSWRMTSKRTRQSSSVSIFWSAVAASAFGWNASARAAPRRLSDSLSFVSTIKRLSHFSSLPDIRAKPSMATRRNCGSFASSKDQSRTRAFSALGRSARISIARRWAWGSRSERQLSRASPYSSLGSATMCSINRIRIVLPVFRSGGASSIISR